MTFMDQPCHFCPECKILIIHGDIVRWDDNIPPAVGVRQAPMKMWHQECYDKKVSE